MSRGLEKLTPGNFYHIYNRGIDDLKIFREVANYGYFFSLYEKYIDKFCDTYAYALMGNHFHLLVRIYDEEDLLMQTNDPQKYISNEFSKLFNAYSQAYNKRYHRTGTVFQHPFKRKRIDTIDYLKRVVIYIHNNPVHHLICSDPLDYKWTSYQTCICLEPTKVRREKVIGIFDNQANFLNAHNEEIDIPALEHFLEI